MQTRNLEVVVPKRREGSSPFERTIFRFFSVFQKTRVKVLRLVFLSFSGPFLGAQTNSANGPV